MNQKSQIIKHSILICLVLTLTSDIVCKAKLLSVVEIVRHGARLSSFYGDPFSKIIYQIQNSQLTQNGFRQHLIFGQTLRHSTYPEFFDQNPEFEILTSPRERCLFSSTGHILGIFPESTINYVNDNKNFEIKEDDLPPGYNDFKSESTIDIHIVNPLKDSIFHPETCNYKGPLPSQSSHEQQILNFLEVSELNDENKTIYDLLPTNPLYVFSDQEIKLTFDNIQKGVLDAFGDLVPYSTWEFPEGDTKYTLTNLENLVDFLFLTRYHFTGIRKSKLYFSAETEKLARLVFLNRDYRKKIGDSPYQYLVANDIFAKILGKFDSEISSFTVLSCHDTNLEYIISNIHDPKKLRARIIESAMSNNEEFDYFSPPFASSFIFELNEDDSTKAKYIKVRFNNVEVEKDWIQGIDYIPGKGIAYDQFTQIFGKRIVVHNEDDWKCALP